MTTLKGASSSDWADLNPLATDTLTTSSYNELTHQGKLSMEYQVETDIGKIKELNERLKASLGRWFTNAEEQRTVSHPYKNFTCTVYFAKGKEDERPAWTPGTSSNNSNKKLHFILEGTPGSAISPKIISQFHFPSDKYTRHSNGVFVKDNKGIVYLAHRGKLTSGPFSLKKREVLDAFSGLPDTRTKIIETEDGKPQPVQFILICELDGPELPQRLWEFAKECRRVAEKIVEDKTP